MRSMLMKSPSFNQIGTALSGDSFDRVTAWVLTEDGKELFLKYDAEALGYHRMGYYYYTDGFLQIILGLSLDPNTKGHMCTVRNRLIDHFSVRGAIFPFLVPHPQAIGQFQKKCISQYSYIVDRGHQELLNRDAFRSVTLDGTFKYLMAVLGQTKHGAKRSIMPSNDIHVVITARSMDGCMFRAKAFAAETVPEVVADLATIPGVYQQTEIIGVDRPKDWDTPLVFAALPSLQCISGDYFHVVFAASRCYGNSLRPAIVKHLQQMAHKWCSTGSAWLDSPFYSSTKGSIRPFSVTEWSAWESP
eukprot:12413075-Karenia_brevis.AAC.1